MGGIRRRSGVLFLQGSANRADQSWRTVEIEPNHFPHDFLVAVDARDELLTTVWKRIHPTRIIENRPSPMCARQGFCGAGADLGMLRDRAPRGGCGATAPPHRSNSRVLVSGRVCSSTYVCRFAARRLQKGPAEEETQCTHG